MGFFVVVGVFFPLFAEDWYLRSLLNPPTIQVLTRGLSILPAVMTEAGLPEGEQALRGDSAREPDILLQMETGGGLHPRPRSPAARLGARQRCSGKGLERDLPQGSPQQGAECYQRGFSSSPANCRQPVRRAGFGKAAGGKPEPQRRRRGWQTSRWTLSL